MSYNCFPTMLGTPLTVSSNDNCTTIATAYDVSVSDLESRNPSLESDCSGLLRILTYVSVCLAMIPLLRQQLPACLLQLLLPHPHLQLPRLLQPPVQRPLQFK